MKDKNVIWLFVGLLALFGGLIVQFYRVQIVEGDKWTRIARQQHQLLIIEPFKRGVFYGNGGKMGHPEKPQPLVVDIPKFHLFADSLSIPEVNREEVVSGLSQILNLEAVDVAKLRAQLLKRSHSRKLVMWVSRGCYEKIEGWWKLFAKKHKIARNALYFVQDYKRSYPHGKMLGTLLHALREDKEEKTGQSIPTGGLELVCNSWLKGKPGKRLLLRSPRHPLDAGKVLSYPEHGADVHLTINPFIQAIMEEEIEKAVQNAGAKGGWAVMMDPRSGEVIGLAQTPSFDPANYRDYFNDPTRMEATRVKAVIDPYEVGSIMKPITLAVALKANADLIKQGKKPCFLTSEKIATASGAFPGRTKPITDTHSHNFLNFELGMQKSSNIYMARLVQRIVAQLGEKWYRDALQDLFGFGLKTGIELPAESIGLLPMQGRKHPNGALEWSTPTPFSLAMGYNILATSMQMLRAYGIFANGGFDVKPILIRKVVKKKRDGSEVVLLDNTKPSRIEGFKRVLDEEIVQQVVSAMKLVTKPGGTARRADIPGFTEAGKTGTAEKIVDGVYAKKIHISSFVGFAPVIAPKFVLIVAIDEAEAKYIPGVGKNYMGGVCAAPAFQEIGRRTLEYLGAEPDDPYGYPSGDKRYNAEKSDMYHKLQQLKKLYDEWNH
jgi:cell division protein FtsI (penicillin-binding protein 3)